MKKFQNLCKCTHSEDSHGMLERVRDGQAPQSNKTHKCNSNNCDCGGYEMDKKVCFYCKEELKNDGPYAMTITNDNPNGGSWEVDDYCLTDGCENFKYKK